MNAVLNIRRSYPWLALRGPKIETYLVVADVATALAAPR
jgi:hypothetical protein